MGARTRKPPVDNPQEGRPSPAGDDDSLPFLSMRRVTGPGPRHLLRAQTQRLWPAPRKLWALPENEVFLRRFESAAW